MNSKFYHCGGMMRQSSSSHYGAFSHHKRQQSDPTVLHLKSEKKAFVPHQANSDDKQQSILDPQLLMKMDPVFRLTFLLLLYHPELLLVNR